MQMDQAIKPLHLTLLPKALEPRYPKYEHPALPACCLISLLKCKFYFPKVLVLFYLANYHLHLGGKLLVRIRLCNRASKCPKLVVKYNIREIETN